MPEVGVPRLFRRNPRSGFGGGKLGEGVGGSDIGWCFGSNGGIDGVRGCSCRGKFAVVFVLIFGTGGVAELRWLKLRCLSGGGGLSFLDGRNDSEEEEDIGAGVGSGFVTGGSTVGLGFEDLWNAS